MGPGREHEDGVVVRWLQHVRRARARQPPARAASLPHDPCVRFWHEFKVTEDDVEWLAFEDVTTLPAVPASRTENEVRLVVDEMQVLRKR